jgi:hypothetical protein
MNWKILIPAFILHLIMGLAYLMRLKNAENTVNYYQSYLFI